MRFLSVMLFVVFIVQPLVFAEEIILSKLTTPKKLLICGNNLIVGEKVKVYIYSLKDFSLKKEFGKAGEGPREFKISAVNGFKTIGLNGNDKKLIITSLNKVSFYTVEGNFLKEKKTTPNHFKIEEIGNQFLVLLDLYEKDRTRVRSLNLVDSKFEKTKEFARFPHDLSMDKGLQLYKNYFGYIPYKDKIFVCNSNDFTIEVFNNSGKKLYTIQKDFKKEKVTQKDQLEAKNYWKIDQPGVYTFFKDKFSFPEYFPIIKSMRVSDDKIYCFTYKKKNGLTECIVSSLDGGKIKIVYVKLEESSPRRWFPFCINNGQLFQLIENEETLEWELHKKKLK